MFDYLFLFNNTYGLRVFTTVTKCPNQVFFDSLVDLQTICAKYELETWFSPNEDICKNLIDMKHGSTKNAFWNVYNKKWCKWFKFDHLSYLITLIAYLCLQRTANAQINYFMLDWSLYTLFVLNRGWKHDSLQIMIFLYVCSTRNIFELKKRFETWITRDDVNGVFV
jgi:hypothetical protein